MVRLLKIACTANLVLAIGLTGVYVLYGLLAGLPIDQYFLGLSGPWSIGRAGGGLRLPTWTFETLFGAIILVTLIMGHYAKWNMRSHRLYCGIFGLVFLLGLTIRLPHRVIFPEDETAAIIPVGIPSFDYVLAIYVWSSYLAYALIGPKDNRSTPH